MHSVVQGLPHSPDCLGLLQTDSELGREIEHKFNEMTKSKR